MVAEVTHSVFYAPLYVAIENNYFKEFGIDVELILTSGADNVAAAVLSNDVHVGFAGAESAIYVYEKGEKDYLRIFSGLTKRDGQFILSRNKIDNFSYNDLIDNEILVGRVAGMPALNFEDALLNNNINMDEVTLNYSVDFADLSSAFISGEGDFVNLFEPTASKLEDNGYGFVVSSVGIEANEVPYTVFYSRKSFIEENKDLIDNFRKAIKKGLDFVHDNNEDEIVKIIYPQFNDLSLNQLKKIVKRYKDSDSWLRNTQVSEEMFINLEDMIIRANILDDYVNYNHLVINE